MEGAESPVELDALNDFLHHKHLNILKIACGDSFTVFLADNGKLYTFGKSHDGATGTRKHPKIVENFEVFENVTPVLNDNYKGEKVVDFKLSPNGLIFKTSTLHLI